MAQVTIPADLFSQIEKVLPRAKSAEEFVIDAVREKLSSEQGEREFRRLSDLTRRAMGAKGVTEAEILDDFDSFRRPSST